MRNTRWFIALVFVFIPLALNAADADKLLNGRRVNDYLLFQVNGTTVHVRVDDTTGATLTDGITFTSPGEIDLVYPNYNPFLMQISLEETVSEDPTSKAVSGFIDALLAMSKVVLPPPPNPVSAADFAALMDLDMAVNARSDCATVRRTCRTTAKAANQPSMLSDLETCEQDYLGCQCGEIQTQIEKATAGIEKVRTISVADTLANRWIATAQGKQGISTVRHEIDHEHDEIVRAIDAANAALTALPKLVAKAETLSCSSLDESLRPDIPTNAELMVLEQDLDTYIAAATKLASSLEELSTTLASFETMRWRNNDQDLVFGSAASDPAQIKTQKITFTSREAKPGTNGTVIALTDGDKETRTFDVRRYRRLVPEVGVAMIYSDLQFPTYTAIEVPAVEGETEKSFKVGKETEDGKIDAALMLNFLCNCIGDETIFPGFQVGISKADDYPGLLAGFSLRFAGLKQISIGTGAMVTWFKEPKSLKVDGPVADQDALDKDLHRRRSPVAWYLGIQYIF